MKITINILAHEKDVTEAINRCDNTTQGNLSLSEAMEYQVSDMLKKLDIPQKGITVDFS